MFIYKKSSKIPSLLLSQGSYITNLFFFEVCIMQFRVLLDELKVIVNLFSEAICFNWRKLFFLFFRRFLRNDHRETVSLNWLFLIFFRGLLDAV